MRAIRVWLVVVAVGSIGNGCSCQHDAGNGGGDGGLDLSLNPDAIAGGDIVIMPKDVTLDLDAAAPRRRRRRRTRRPRSAAPT